MTQFDVKQRAELTFRYDQRRGRYGWLRLTPAYSSKVVHDILTAYPYAGHILDPFAGTGTTALAAAEYGIPTTLIEINPFLAWLSRVKTRNYTDMQIQQMLDGIDAIWEVAEQINEEQLWYPPMRNIERWWQRDRLRTLARLYAALQRMTHILGDVARDILLLAFCKVLMKWSNATFQHQSLSLLSSHDSQLTLLDEEMMILQDFDAIARQMAMDAADSLPVPVVVIQGDARTLALRKHSVDYVLTSPPYPNRMSYVREVRPYMYWLRYLGNGRTAGEWDWSAIGGTWGVATSRLAKWQPPHALKIPALKPKLREVAEHSTVLANYIHRYFLDIQTHIARLQTLLAPGSHLFYIVGNSRFYDVLLPVESFYEILFQHYGFEIVGIEILRKRNSKKELFEYLIHAWKRS